MKGIEAWKHNSEKIVSCRCRASISRPLSFFVFVFFVFFRFTNPTLLNFHRRKNEAKTGKKKHKQNKTEQNWSNAFVALKETHVFEESGTTKASVSDRFPAWKSAPPFATWRAHVSSNSPVSFFGGRSRLSPYYVSTLTKELFCGNLKLKIKINGPISPDFNFKFF
jgi:hypothetical protein